MAVIGEEPAFRSEEHDPALPVDLDVARVPGEHAQARAVQAAHDNCAPLGLRHELAIDEGHGPLPTGDCLLGPVVARDVEPGSPAAEVAEGEGAATERNGADIPGVRAAIRLVRAPEPLHRTPDHDVVTLEAEPGEVHPVAAGDRRYRARPSTFVPRLSVGAEPEPGTVRRYEDGKRKTAP